MKKVITYGTYDLLHYGHIRLLERAKELGDYLIVGVTADDFDLVRGKINVQQSLMERVEAVRATGIADEIIIEEYEGQKIDDIRRLDVDVFTVGSDWVGYFDYLKEYCEVVYLDRTEGVSSSEIRAEKRELTIGLIGSGTVLEKHRLECDYVNGIKVAGICSTNIAGKAGVKVYESVDALLEEVDSVYIFENPRNQYEIAKKALQAGKHVLCEAPVAIYKSEISELYQLAEEKGLVLMEAIKTAYATAFNRLQLLIKGGRIGKVVSIDAICTSMREIEKCSEEELATMWNSLYAWGPTALLPVFQLLGTDYRDCVITSHFADRNCKYDAFSKIDLRYDDAVASVKVGQGVKSEGELIISGTQGYVYVPAPWWKTDYFEIRYEDPANNKRYFYQLEGEGIRYEIVAFVKAIESGKNMPYIERDVVEAISGVMEKLEQGDVVKI
ncbi:MAG: Gfo/Idh/MocA family oxidoreductase [Pseudobutyrivibrio sp.]|nr:Gfo/Idh/MocA family oxidoreductase [Pseudobutyrivibrio sp.]